MSDAASVREPDPEIPFEIGLVMAGAISAGAYTAGVIDFLVQALDEWENAKAFANDHPDDPKGPGAPAPQGQDQGHGRRFGRRHDLRPRRGAAGNGLRVGRRAAAPRPALRPRGTTISTEAGSTRSTSTPCLVPRISTAAPTPRSSRCSTPRFYSVSQTMLSASNVPTLAMPALRGRPAAHLRDRYQPPGIRYPVLFSNYTSRDKVKQYEMTMHADNMHFILSENQPPSEQGAFWLKPYDFKNPRTWGLLEKAALATGCLPCRPGCCPAESALVAIRRPPLATDWPLREGWTSLL